MTNKIGKNSMYAEFSVTFEAEIAKPIVDKEFEFKIEQVQRTGIFGTVEKMLRIFVPSNYLQDWTFLEDERNTENNRYQRQSDGYTVGLNSVVKAEIKHIKYLVDKFGCISRLL